MLSLRMSKGAQALPISAAQLARAVPMTRPISLRALLTATGSRTRRPRICLLRYQWQTPKPGDNSAPIWPDWFFDEVFSRPNGWSLRDYWYRVSAGLVDIDVVVAPWHTLEKDQSAKDSNDRAKVIQMCRDQAATDHITLDGFDHVIAFLYPGNNNSGAYGGDAVFDQSPFSLEFYQHEMGHQLGFSHACGTRGDYVYEDPWCVMGFSLDQGHPVATTPVVAAVPLDDPNGFWRSGRRLSTAALFRYDGSTEFASTPGVVHLDVTGGPQTVTLVAAGESRLYDPVVAVLKSDFFVLTVEYRTPTGDDVGIRSAEKIRSAVIVHSIGRRQLLRWQGERDPVWLEAEIPADPLRNPKADIPDAWITHGWDKDDVHVELTAVTGSRATVRISRGTPS